jgi:hypothetical protein
MTTYAIATSSGQIRFLSDADAWVLAPSRAIRTFPSRTAAERFVRENPQIAAFQSQRPSVLTYLANPRVGNR